MIKHKMHSIRLSKKQNLLKCFLTCSYLLIFQQPSITDIYHQTIEQKYIRRHQLIAIIFIILSTPNMIFSAISKNRVFITQLQLFSFAIQPNRQSNQLNQQIIQARTWKKFWELFSSKKSEFTPDTLKLTSRSINRLLTRQRESVRYNQLAQLIEVIQKVELTNSSENDIVSFLALLRTFNTKGLRSKSLYKFKNQLCTRYNQLLSAKPEGTQNIQQLVFAYFQAAYFNQLGLARLISERLLKRITQERQNDGLITLSQAVFLLSGLATKEELDQNERKIRAYVLKTLVKSINTLEPNDLANVIASLKKMSLYDAFPHQFGLIKTLGNKMVEKITEIDQKSIFYLLRGENNNQNSIFIRIYDEIRKNTYSQIDQNGNTTTVDKMTILKVIGSLSSRVSFNRLAESEKKKFLSFLGNLQLKDNSAKRVFQQNISDIIKNRHYDVQKPQEFIKILLKQGLKPRVHTLQYLYNNRTDIHGFLTDFLSVEFREELSAATAIKHSTLVKRLIQNTKYADHKQQLQNYVTRFTKIIEESFKTPQTFTETFDYFFKNSELQLNLRSFHDYHDQYFNQLINPFEVQDPNLSPQYKVKYLQYVTQAFRQPTFYKFMGKYQNKIDRPTILRVILAHTSQSSKNITPNEYILILGLRNLAQAFELKDREFIVANLEILNKYNFSILLSHKNSEIGELVIRIIQLNFSKFDALKQLNLSNLFSSYFSRYVTRYRGNYKNEEIFHQLLVKSLKYLDKMPAYAVPEVIRQALRINALEKKHIQNIDLSKFDSLTNERHTIQYLKDQSYTPQIKTITAANLQTILYNPNLQGLIKERQSEIDKVLQTVRISELFGYLTVNNQPNSAATNSVITKILTLLNSSEEPFQRYDFQGALKRLVDVGYFNSQVSIQFSKKIISLLTNKMGNFSLWTHFQAIRFSITIPGLNFQQYYTKLIDYASKNLTNQDVEQLLFRLSYTNYQFNSNDLKHVKSSLRRNIFKGVSLFLATENQHPQAERKEIVSQIAKKLKQAKEEESLIQNLQYLYLKNTYAEQTKELSLKPEQLQTATFSFKPRARILNILQLIAKLHQTTLSVLPDLKDNYLVKIHNFCFVFFSPRRVSNVHQKQFVKKALPFLLKGQDHIFVFIGAPKLSKFADYLERQAPQLIIPFRQAIIQQLQKEKPEKTQQPTQPEQNQTKPPKPERAKREKREKQPTQPSESNKPVESSGASQESSK